MMPKLAVDFRSEESRVRLYYAAAVSLFGALASRLVASSLLPWNDGGQGLFWCGAIALSPLVLYGWRALPAAALLAVAVEAISRGQGTGALFAALGDVVEAVVAYGAMASLTPFDPRFRTQDDLQRFVLASVVVVPTVSGVIGTLAIGPTQAMPALSLWFGWATADATAVLMTVPMALVWVTQARARGPRWMEIAALAGAACWLLLMVGWLTPRVALWIATLAVIALPFAFWAAIAYGRRGASLSALLIAVALVAAARFDVMPFPNFSPLAERIALAGLLASVLVGLLVVAIARAEQDRAQDQILESESRLRMMMQSASVVPYAKAGPHFLDYSYIGERAVALFGHPMAEWEKPRAWINFIHPDDRDRMRHSAAEALPLERDCEWEYRLQRADGGTVWVRDLFRVDRKVGGALELRGMMIDVSGQKQRELELEESRQALEAAKNQAEAANRAKTAFLATVSHELRTPMNAVIGFADVLTGEAFGKLNERQRECVADIASSGRHLLRMINDILDMSKIEAGRFPLIEEVFDLSPVLAQAARLVTQEIDGKEISFSTHISLGAVGLNADQRAVTQIVVNLLTNAAKFTRNKGRVELKATAGPEGLTVSVTDTGRGMSAETIERAFEPFFQGSDSDVSRKRAGTGLGLAISRRLAEMHGGTVTLKSRPGEGTVATLWLPPDRLQ
ncbi:MAG TPA: ATP-binding protein [Candidatus Cybelea sp.]|nr:ATP-binding protein [Candidatus Cybelea sp.]